MSKNTWGNRVVYQIYPRSFKDTTGTGVGDLNGIIEKLDYLKDLGIGALWLSPINCSPMKDFGYDISNYKDIDPLFGTLKDFENLIAKAHAKDIKVLMDFVPNHTSIEHPWFQESRSSLDNSKRDWYIWKKPKRNGEAPNNWLSQFGGSAWKFDEATKEYYLHTFDKSQPDLNWRNPKVVARMTDVLRFWLRKGVDGFRVDVAYHLFKDPFFRDEPYNPTYNIESKREYNSLHHIYTVALPETIAMLKKLHSVINEVKDSFMICEIYTFPQEIVNLYKIVDHQNFAPFNFSFLSLKWNAQIQKKFIDEFDEMIGEEFFPTYVLGNHDSPRIVSKIGAEAARVAALLQLTLRGIPFIYYGEELGMSDGNIPEEKAKDPMTLNMKGFHFGRDPVRTPMQWDDTRYGGFSENDPWLPLEEGYKLRNVESEGKDDTSFLNLYKSILQLRKERMSLSKGKYFPIECKNPDVFQYIRRGDDDETLITANFSKEAQEVDLPDGKWKVLLSTYLDLKDKNVSGKITLRADEGVVLCE